MNRICLTIRLATLEDLEKAITLVTSCTHHMDEHGIHQWDDIYPDKATIESDIEKQQLFIGEADGEVCGIVTLNNEQSPEYQSVNWLFSGKILVVHRLAIAPTHQRQGLARELMNFAHSYAETRDCEAIRLDAFVHNPAAVGLYEHLGYRKAGSVKFRKGTFFCYEKEIPRR